MATKSSSDERTNHLVRDGERVVLTSMNGNNREWRIVRVESEGRWSKIKLARNMTCKSTDLIGVPYGSVVEFDRNKLTVVEGDTSLSPDMKDWIKEGETDKVPTVDNRNIVDRNDSQNLDCDKIAEMKEKGASGRSIIDALVKNSATFQEKTAFSKAKYLKRKIQKFLRRFRVERCNPMTVAGSVCNKDSRKVCALRWDSIAQILSYANVRPGANILCMDNANGLVASSIAHRTTSGRNDDDLSKSGCIISVHLRDTNFKKASEEHFNFSSSERDKIVHISLEKLHRLVAEDKNVEDSLPPKKLPQFETTNDGDDGEARYRRMVEAHRRRVNRRAMVRGCLRRGVDSLVIVCDGVDDDPVKLLRLLLPHLKLACPFVLFCPHLEPIAECFRSLKEDERPIAIDLQLSETWTREVQVLPLRTHPMMMMHGHSGYILRGITVGRSCDEPSYAAAARVASLSRRRRGKRKSQTKVKESQKTPVVDDEGGCESKATRKKLKKSEAGV
eukprot:g1224.t1